MAYQAIVHQMLWKELHQEAHEEVKAAMKALAGRKDPAAAPNVRPLANSNFRGSFRLRVGRFRVLFILLPDEAALVFTTAFEKKRDSDYDGAVERHDRRVRRYE